MSASVSPHGFETVRGRGYRPEDVDRRFEGLSIDRDSCWERAARLTVLCNEMDVELAALRAHVAQLPEETYESLGTEARLILTTAESEAARLRTEAAQAAKDARVEADAYGGGVRDAADRTASALRTEADELARRTEERAEHEAARLVAAAAKEAGRLRAGAAEELAETARRTEQMLRDQEKQQAEEWDAAGRRFAERDAEMDLLVADLDSRGQGIVAEHRRLLAEAEEAARHHQEAAEDRGAGLLARARVEVERIERATERILREHQERREEVRSHMTHVRNSLAALTGKAPVPEDDDPGSGAGGHPGGPDDPDEQDTVETRLPRTRGSADG
ncbi:cellulose-binding protein [Streptomyces sp. NPDC048506]|uniref:cellulose-binding protein n=1 Tax=Streptomyces sp. NPDC048506 TaxID=3155028 RepID=UPI00344197E8